MSSYELNNSTFRRQALNAPQSVPAADEASVRLYCIHKMEKGWHFSHHISESLSQVQILVYERLVQYV